MQQIKILVEHNTYYLFSCNFGYHYCTNTNALENCSASPLKSTKICEATRNQSKIMHVTCTFSSNITEQLHEYMTQLLKLKSPIFSY